MVEGEGVKEGSEAGEVQGGGGVVGRGRPDWRGGRCLAAGCFNAFWAAALSRVVHAAVPIPAVADVSVLHCAAVVGFDADVVGPF